MNKYKEFLNYMEADLSGLPTLQASRLLEQAGAERLYLVFVDIINGFCEEGALASDRVAEMVEPVRQLAQFSVSQGIPRQNLIFLQDDHTPNAVEFGSFPPHCVRGTTEADTVKELRPFLEAPGARLFRKNATNGLFGRDAEGLRFFEFLEGVFREGPATFVVTGKTPRASDCWQTNTMPTSGWWFPLNTPEPSIPPLKRRSPSVPMPMTGSSWITCFSTT